MARKTKVITIDTEDRDKGKQFFITEMDAWKAEKWALRAVTILINSGVDIPEGAAQSGMAGMAAIGLNALHGLDFKVAEPLIDELLECVAFIPPATPEMRFKDLKNHVEEVKTFLRLRAEAFLIHTDFSWGEIHQKLTGSSVDSPKS